LAVDLKFWTFACYFAHQIICWKKVFIYSCIFYSVRSALFGLIFNVPMMASILSI
jgi:ABC-type multidrug transport system permease subunit